MPDDKMSAQDAAAKAAHSGHLTKLGKVRKNWKRRYFALVDTNLHYYQNDKAEKPIKTIVLTGSTVAGEEEVSGKGPSFHVRTPDRKWVMVADTEEDCKSWLGALQKCLESMPGRTDAVKEEGEGDQGTTITGGSQEPVEKKKEITNEMVVKGEVAVICNAVAQFNFEPLHNDELTLTVGDKIEVVEQRPDGWWRGKNQKNEAGLFPANHVSQEIN